MADDPFKQFGGVADPPISSLVEQDAPDIFKQLGGRKLNFVTSPPPEQILSSPNVLEPTPPAKPQNIFEKFGGQAIEMPGVVQPGYDATQQASLKVAPIEIPPDIKSRQILPGSGNVPTIPATTSLRRPTFDTTLEIPTSSEELGRQNLGQSKSFSDNQMKQQQAALDQFAQASKTPQNTVVLKSAYFNANQVTPPEPRATKFNLYHSENGQLVFAPNNPVEGLDQAVQDGAVDAQWAMKQRPILQKAQELTAKMDKLKKDAVGNQQLQALLHGAVTGTAFVAGMAPGAAGGAEIGALTGPLSPIAIPALGMVGGLVTGSMASSAAKSAIRTIGEYNDFFKSVSASSELQPQWDAAGNLIAFGTQAPKSLYNLAKVAQMSGKEAAKQVAGGAIGGAAFTAIRPGFDYAQNLAKDALGIQHEDVVPPSASELAQNVALGVMLHGHGLKFKDYSSPEVANILMRGGIRDKMGIALDQPKAELDILKQFDQLNPDAPKGGYQQYTAPLTPAEQSIYKTISKQLVQLENQSGGTGIAGDKAKLMARQISLPDFLGRPGKTLTTTGVALKPGEATPEGEPSYAPTTEQNQTGFQVKRIGTDEVGQTTDQASPGDSVPGAAGQPPQRQFTPPPPVEVPEVAPITPVAPVAPAAPAPMASGEVAPVKFHQLQAMMPGIQWYSVDKAFTAPDGKTYEPGHFIDNGQLAKWGYKIPPAEGQKAQETAAKLPKQNIQWQGLNIAIENQKGSIRSGIDKDGTPWLVKMPAAYGYVAKTKGMDKEPVDVYVGPNPNSGRVFVFDQKNPETGQPDEHKSFIGFDTPEAAADAYHHAFSDKSAAQRFGAAKEFTVQQFKDWLADKKETQKPVGASLRPKKPVKAADMIPRSIGTNINGEEVFEDKRGVRSIVDRGVRRNEPVQMIPTQSGIQMGTDREANPEFKTTTELAGYKDDAEMQKDFQKSGLQQFKETIGEFVRRKYCQGLG